MAFLGYEQAPSNFVSIVGDALENALTKREQGKVQKRNQQLLEGLGIRRDIAAPLSHQPEEQIFNFLKQFEGFDIGNPQQQMNPQQLLNQQNPAQVAPQQGQNNMQNQPNNAQNTAQNNQNDVNGMLKQLYTDYPELRNQIGPEQLGQLD